MDHPCFWCQKPLTKATRTKDHFLSKPLWRHQRPNLPDRSPKCASCAHCNSRRGAISGLYLELQRLKRKYNEKKMRGWLKGKKKLLSDIYEFRQKINATIEDQYIKKLCIRELDEILAYGIDKKAVEVRAYYLWESAGRPDGRHEEFWFQAERQLMNE